MKRKADEPAVQPEEDSDGDEGAAGVSDAFWAQASLDIPLQPRSGDALDAGLPQLPRVGPRERGWQLG